MTRLPIEIEELLAQLVSGEVDASDERVRSAVAQHGAALEERLEALAPVAKSLDELALEERADVEAAPEPSAEDRELVRRLSAKHRLDAPPARGRRSWLRLLAAAVVLLLGTWLGRLAFVGSQDSGDGLTRMGNGQLELSRPVALEDGTWKYTWEFDLPANGYYTVRFRPAAAGAPLLERETEESRCTLTPTEHDSLGSAYSWSVDAYDASGPLLSSFSRDG